MPAGPQPAPLLPSQALSRCPPPRPAWAAGASALPVLALDATSCRPRPGHPSALPEPPWAPLRQGCTGVYPGCGWAWHGAQSSPWAAKQAESRSGYLQAGAAASDVCLHNQLEQFLVCVVSFTLSVRRPPRFRIWPPLHWGSPAQGLLRKRVLGTSISRAGGPCLTPPPPSSQQQPWGAQERSGLQEPLTFVTDHQSGIYSLWKIWKTHKSKNKIKANQVK